jgi:hypothetical protein
VELALSQPIPPIASTIPTGEKGAIIESDALIGVLLVGLLRNRLGIFRVTSAALKRALAAGRIRPRPGMGSIPILLLLDNVAVVEAYTKSPAAHNDVAEVSVRDATIAFCTRTHSWRFIFMGCLLFGTERLEISVHSSISPDGSEPLRAAGCCDDQQQLFTGRMVHVPGWER